MDLDKAGIFMGWVFGSSMVTVTLAVLGSFVNQIYFIASLFSLVALIVFSILFVRALND